ncbi:stalk domain-containing protein [Paenibacillus sp. KN14-4R]|uniref:stalk domain-containing protein n=1 Tax=Paenibacillus sp. KN14-4R TaxID=3445773 RepID=UPI003FA10CF4
MMKIPFKLLSLSLAGCCLLASASTTTWASSTPPVSEQKAVTPISAKEQQLVKVTTKSIKEKTDKFEVNLSVPVISGMKDKKYQDQLNDIIERTAMKDLESLKKQAETDFADFAKEGLKVRPYTLDSTYEVKSDGNQADQSILSLRLLTSVYTGGAHGLPRIDTYNVLNADEAKRLELKNLLSDNYKQVADQHIKADIAKNPEKYFAGDLGFKGITDTTLFFVNKGDAVITFNVYEIAPYSSGTPEFRIPIAKQSAAKVITVSGKELALDDASIFTNEKGVTMIPLRAVASKLGFAINWNEEKQSVDLHKDAIWTSITVDKDQYFIAKMAAFPLGTAPTIQEGKMYVPLAFFSDVLKVDVKVNGRSISIM